MNKATFLMGVTLTFLAVALEAERPRHPLVGGLQAGDAWEVEVLAESARTPVPGEPSAGRPTPKQPDEVLGIIEKNVMGRDFREQTVFPVGKETPVWRRWAKGGYIFYAVEGIETFEMDVPGEMARGGPIAANRLAEFDWVAPEWQKGTAFVDGAECLIYARPETDAGPGAKPVVAAIGVTDLRPRRLEDSVAVRRYRWRRETPPAFPAGAAAALATHEQELQRQVQRHNVPR